MKRRVLVLGLLLALARLGSAQVLRVTTLAGFPIAGHRDGVGDLARFSGPLDVAADSFGHIYVVDGHTIRKVTPFGEVTTFAGSPDSKQGDWADGVGAAARFSFPGGLAVDHSGNVFVAEGCKLRKISPAGVVSTILGGPNYLCGYTDGPPGTAQIHDVRRIAVGFDGVVYFTSTYGHTIRRMTPAGVVTTIAGQDDTPGYRDGGNSRFRNPYGIAVDRSGSVFVADMGNGVVRKIDLSNNVTTFANVAAQQLAVLPSGDLIAIVENVNIFKIRANGVAIKVAGGQFGAHDGTGNAAQFGNPQGITSDSIGEVYIADTLNTTIRRGVFVSERRRAVRK